MFNTPILSPFVRFCSIVFLKITGWEFDGEVSRLEKCVMIAAPHTSNWDLPMMLVLVFAAKRKLYWLGKKSLFQFPLNILPFRWLGGIPIDRKISGGFVDQAVELFKNNSQLVLAVQPEGTRKKVPEWRTGFYIIAHKAKVPIVLGYMDFSRKVASVRKEFIPTGDIEADMKEIRKFYVGIKGKNPQNQ